MSYKQGLLNRIFKAGCVRRANTPQFKLKSGCLSDLYVDLRQLISHPKLLNEVSTVLNEEINRHFQEFTHVAGIVAGGVPLCTLVSQASGKPMLMIRTERKKHGTGNLIEGLPDSKASVVLIEDVLTTGTSVRETISKITEDVEIVGCVCVVNRSGKSVVPETDIPLFGIWTEQELVEAPETRLSLLEREKVAIDPMGKKIFKIMRERQTNLVWSADIQKQEDLFERLDLIGEFILGVKMHFDVFSTPFDTERFNELLTKHKLIMINDRKYADIQNTVLKQSKLDSEYRGNDERSLSTVHTVSGSGSVLALHKNNVSSILIAEMSNSGSYVNSLVARNVARCNSDKVTGFVCQNRSSCDAGDAFVYFTPGVSISQKSDGQDQNYRNCDQAIYQQRNDVIIVGRGISNTPLEKVKSVAKNYRDAGWNSFIKK